MCVCCVSVLQTFEIFAWRQDFVGRIDNPAHVVAAGEARAKFCRVSVVSAVESPKLKTPQRHDKPQRKKPVAHLKAAKTVIPACLSPRCGPIRDQQGFAVSHFAFVRGSSNGFDGAFPGDKGVKLQDIKDGTVNTLSLGEVSHGLGPWIAERVSTARQLHLPEDNMPGTFGSLDNKTCWFSTCDSYPRLFRFDKLKPETWRSLATRSGGEFIDYDDFDSAKN
jgi:hypothetical protein